MPWPVKQRAITTIGLKLMSKGRVDTKYLPIVKMVMFWALGFGLFFRDVVSCLRCIFYLEVRF